MHYGPSFTIKREPQFGIPILQGMTVMLGCDVDANPVINATGWLKNEKQLPAVGNPVLVLHDVDIKDVGWYQCTTTYYGETISSIGYFLNIHPVENEFFDEEHDSNEEQTGIVIFFWSLTFISFLIQNHIKKYSNSLVNLCNTFLLHLCLKNKPRLQTNVECLSKT